MQLTYILDGHTPVPCDVDGLIAWWRERGDQWRIVAQDKRGEVLVSTVFLAINHAFLNDGPPILFETMIFGGEHDQFQRRYATWEQAEQGHKEALAMVDNELSRDGLRF